jgi:hypothetical protein
MYTYSHNTYCTNISTVHLHMYTHKFTTYTHIYTYKLHAYYIHTVPTYIYTVPTYILYLYTYTYTYTYTTDIHVRTVGAGGREKEEEEEKKRERKEKLNGLAARRYIVCRIACRPIKYRTRQHSTRPRPAVIDRPPHGGNARLQTQPRQVDKLT